MDVGRIDGVEMRLDMDDRVILVPAIEETSEPELIRKIGVCPRREQRDHAC
jgi:hypothetical protein